MSKYFTSLLLFGIAILLVGGIFCVYQLFRLVQTDADCRGLKHPKLWGWFAAAGNNNSSILFYFIVRKKHPVIAMSDAQKQYMDKCKKKIGVGLIFLCAGAILCVLCMFLFSPPASL